MLFDLRSRVQKQDAHDPRRSSEQASKVKRIKVTPWRNAELYELSRLASNSGLQASSKKGVTLTNQIEEPDQSTY